jgi:flagellar motor switch protein FliN/FliY
MEKLVEEPKTATAADNGELNLDSLLDVPVDMAVEIGRTKMTIGELLSLTKGSIVELKRSAAEAVDIYVNGKLLGKGEVIVVNERLGVRVVKIIAPVERVQKLACLKRCTVISQKLFWCWSACSAASAFSIK